MILISGTVKVISSMIAATLLITDYDSKIITVAQPEVHGKMGGEGEFIHSIRAGGIMKEGVYTIKAQYGQAKNSAKTNFEYIL